MEPSATQVNQQLLTNHLMLDIGWQEMLEMALTMTDNQSTIAAGSATTYVASVSNNGPGEISLANTVVTSATPPGLSAKSWNCVGSASASCGSASGSGAVNTTVFIPLGGMVTFTINATISAAFSGTLTNSLTLNMPTNISNTSSSSASDNTTVTNSNSPGITVSAISGDTTEAGGTASFTIVLDAQPSASVSIGISSSDTSEGTVLPATVSFTTGDWSTPKPVTVTGVNDDIDDENMGYIIITAPAVSGDSDYNGENPANVTVFNQDNDTVDILVSGISGDTTEAGGTATFTIVLNSEPTADVTIGLSTSDSDEGSPSLTSVTFDSGNWGDAVTITVTGEDDDIDDGNASYSIITDPAVSSDGKYTGMSADNVSITNQDDDDAGISVSSISGDTTEAGGTATFTIVLDSEPTNDVTIDLSSSESSEGTPSPTSVTFDSGDWDSAKTITVTGVDDDIDDNDRNYSIITDPATSGDGNYSGMNAGNVSVSNQDDDSAGISVSVISGPTNEAGKTATFTIVLDSEPTADVTIALSSSDTTEGTVAPTSVTFNAGNWDTTREVTVTGQPDAESDGTVAYSILTDPASSGDSNYSGMDADDVDVSNEEDNDYIFGSDFEA